MWAATSTIRIDDLYVGVRSHPRDIDAALRSALPDHLVAGVEAPANYSIRRAERGKASSAHVVYRAQCAWLRTRSLARALRALASSLRIHLEQEEMRLPRIRQLVLHTGSSVVLLPHELLPRLERIESRLNEQGLRLADLPFASLDPATGEVVVEPLPIEVDEGALDAADGPQARRGAAAPPGRYRASAWGILHRDREAPLRPADALGAVLPALDREAAPDLQRAADAVATSLAGAQVAPVWFGGDDALLRWIGSVR